MVSLGRINLKLKLTFKMKKYWVLFFVLASCGPEEIPYLPVEQRETVEILDQELIEIRSWYFPENSSSKILSLKRVNQPGKDSLTLADTLVMSQFVREIGWIPWNSPYSGGMNNFFYNNGWEFYPFYILGSGQIKESDPRDSLPGLPFLLEKIVQTPPCPVVIPERRTDYPLQNIPWKWIGFIDESGEVYSHPYCEGPSGSIQFTQKGQSVPGYVTNQPNALLVEFSTGVSNFYDSPFFYEIKGNQVSLYTSYYYGPNRHQTSFPLTTKRVYEKQDSVKRVIAPGELDFQIQGNRLIISRNDTDLRLLYMAN